MKLNYHTHSNCSPDSTASMSEMAQAAIREGITELCFTDHCDLLNVHGERISDFDWSPILARHAQIVADLGDKIALPLGLELGGAIHSPALAEKILSLPNLDFVIGSIHNPGGLPDIFYMDFKSEASCLQIIDIYIDELVKLSATDYFDVLGHLTYPLRYIGRAGHNLSFERHFDALREIFRNITGNGRGIELNTSGYRHPGGAPMPPLNILKLYRDCGGEIITLGSDAHRPEHIATGLNIGRGLLRQAGFKYLTVYRRRKPEFVQLD